MGNSTITVNLHIPQIINQLSKTLHTSAKNLVEAFIPWAKWTGITDLCIGILCIIIFGYIGYAMISIVSDSDYDTDKNTISVILLIVCFAFIGLGLILVRHGIVNIEAPKAIAIEHIINTIMGRN